ncbi:GntR family transcriptional regulator [Pseudonocardia sp. C8]|uniref:GntR family transcriptional regulator n=1 Tax=Pseudonocardia sp. C8 TaxID=2762759 RepID=UPI0016428459|nr:GntR family transcriptional regulator [Pseudonocardia sp. C8]MBC3193110.1 GntR family transcriptional regulator [Pseudonocardia sp. C8]
MSEGTPSDSHRPSLDPGERLSPQIARLIRELIMNGEAKGHSWLRTEHLGSRFGVSATPVREALMSLHGEGLVSFHPGRGFQVVPMTRQDLLDLYDAQAHFAGELTSRAAPLLTDQDLELLQQMQQDLIRALEEGDGVGAESIEIGLHRVINVAADAPKLRWLLKSTTRYAPFRSWSSVPHWSTAAPDDHLLILRSLERRSATTAGAAMTAHIHNVADLLADHLMERGVLVEDHEAAPDRMRSHLADVSRRAGSRLPGRRDRPAPGSPPAR